MLCSFNFKLKLDEWEPQLKMAQLNRAQEKISKQQEMIDDITVLLTSEGISSCREY